MSFQFHIASEKFISQFNLTEHALEHHALFIANRATSDMFACYGEAEGAHISAIGTRYGQVVLSSRNVRQTLFRESRDQPIELVRFNYSGNMIAVFYGARMTVIDIRTGNTRCAIDLPSASANITFASLTDENVFFCDSQFPERFYSVELRTGTCTHKEVAVDRPRHFDDQLCVVGSGTSVELFDDIASSMESQTIDVGVRTNLDVKIAPGRVPFIWTLGSDGIACVNFGTRRVVRHTCEVPVGSELITNGDRCVVATRSGQSYMFQMYRVTSMFSALEPVGPPRIVEHPIFGEPVRFVYSQEGLIPFMQGAMMQIAIIVAMIQASTGHDGLLNVEEGVNDPSADDDADEDEDDDADDDSDFSDETPETPESCGQQAVLDKVRGAVAGIEAWANVCGWSAAQYLQARRCAQVFTGPRTKFGRSVSDGISATDAAIRKVRDAHAELTECLRDVVHFFGASDSMGVFEGQDESPDEPAEPEPAVPMTRAEATRVVSTLPFDISAPDELVVSPTIRRDIVVAMVKHIYGNEVMHTVNTGVVATLNVMMSQLHDTLVDLQTHRTRLESLVPQTRGVKRSRSE